MDQKVNNSNYDWRSEFERLEGAYAPATMRAYYSDVQAFVDWCEAFCQVPFPASVGTVCDFLEEQGKELAPSSVRRRLYAIRKVHALLDLPDPTHHEDINLTYRRINRRNAVRPKQAKALTRDYLDRFLATEPNTPWGLRNRAMLSLGYELLTRRSELVALRTTDIETTKDGTLRVLIRRSKADPFGEGRLAFTSCKTASLVLEWLDWRGPEIEWLFCPIYQAHALNRSLETTTVKRLVKTAARRAGLDQADIDAFSGHSLRVGAAQDLLVKGFDTVAIMRAGGWKTVGVLARYLEKAEHNVWG
jgi:site-specific recombinase XerD